MTGSVSPSVHGHYLFVWCFFFWTEYIFETIIVPILEFTDIDYHVFVVRLNESGYREQLQVKDFKNYVTVSLFCSKSIKVNGKFERMILIPPGMFQSEHDVWNVLCST